MLVFLYLICTVLTLFFFFQCIEEAVESGYEYEACALGGVALFLGPFAYAIPLILIAIALPVWVGYCLYKVGNRLSTGYYWQKKEEGGEKTE